MKVRRKVSAKATAAMKEVLAWVSALIVIIPFLIVVFNSFKTAHESINMSLTPAKCLTLGKLQEVWEVGNIPRSYMNSFIISSFGDIQHTQRFNLCICDLQAQNQDKPGNIYILCPGADVSGQHGNRCKDYKAFGVYNTVWG